MNRRDLSLGRLALFSMGAAVGVLAVVTAVLTIVRPSPVVGLVIVVVGLVAAVAAMGLVSSRMVASAVNDPDDGGGQDPAADD